MVSILKSFYLFMQLVDLFFRISKFYISPSPHLFKGFIHICSDVSAGCGFPTIGYHCFYLCVLQPYVLKPFGFVFRISSRDFKKVFVEL